MPLLEDGQARKSRTLVLRGFTTGADCRQALWIHLRINLSGEIHMPLPRMKLRLYRDYSIKLMLA